MKNHNYYVYIITNFTRTVLYTGVTNDLSRRMAEHYENRGNLTSFSGRYNCHILLFWERYSYVKTAIEREKEIKKMSRARKEALIATMNKDWEALDPD